MDRLKRNLLANLAGSAWLALNGLIFAPIYIGLLGVESYGLIGFYYALQAALQIFDLGLSPTINREMARYSAQAAKADEARDFVQTFEMGYWGIGLLLGLGVWIAAPLISTHWFKATTISSQTLQQAVISMGALIVLQWPLSFYEGGMLGLQRQVLLNGIQIIMTALRSVGATLILWLVSPTIVAFFYWQIAVSALHIGVMAICFRRSLPPATRPAHFDLNMVRNVWHFAVGMSGITLSTLLLHQLDRVILSGVLSLEAFGYYTLGSTVANSLIMIIGAVFNTTFPRLSELVVLGAEENIKRFYHLCSQLMATLIFPAAVMLFFFSYEILLLWTQNARTANTVAPIVSVLVVGTALYGVRYTPYTLQLARGWTHIPLYINVALIPLYLPAVFFVAVRLGAIGAALMWVVLNIVYLAISVALTHRRFLKGYAWRWMLKDVAPPLGTSILVALVGRQVMTSLVSSFVAGLQLLAVYAIALVASVLAVDRTRVWAFTQLAAGFRRLA